VLSFAYAIHMKFIKQCFDGNTRDSARILRPLVTFADQIFFLKIMNKQEYNELNLIISYFALLVSNGD